MLLVQDVAGRERDVQVASGVELQNVLARESHDTPPLGEGVPA